MDWNYTTAHDRHSTQCHINKVYKATRGKMLGGTSSLNSMMVIRGDPEDYNEWARITKDETWNFANVLPYFIKSERLENNEILNSTTGYLHGSNGYLGVTKETSKDLVPYLEAFKEMGHKLLQDINGNSPLGYGEVMYSISHGERQSTAQSFLSTIINRKNLYVLKHALVTKILFDENKNTVGVKINQNKTEFHVLAKVEVIISAGTINSPQLLMLSGVGPKKQLKRLEIPIISDIPVGLNLQDHISSILVHILDEVHPPKVANPHKLVPVINGFVSLDKNPHRDYQSITVIFPSREFFAGFCSHIIGFKDDICQQIYEKTKEKQIVFTNVVDVLPKSRGEIVLRSCDPKEAPSIHLKPYSNHTDIDNMMRFMEDFRKIENSSYFKSKGAKLFQPNCIEDLKMGSRNYWRKYILCMSTNLYHFAGSCPMGSVVDNRLRVLGVGRLRVVDASAMPLITRANPNPSVIMMAEKAADMIKEDNGMKVKYDDASGRDY